VIRLPAVAIIVAALLLPLGAVAQPKEYASLFLQGRLSDEESGRPLARVAVRLLTDDATYEALSDSRGVFRFEKLPLERFELRITTPDGRVIHGVQRGDPDDPDGTRFRLKLGRGYGAGIRIETTRERISVDVPPPETRWSKLWTELTIFLIVAGGLSL
jgi:hypothetical protein